MAALVLIFTSNIRGAEPATEFDRHVAQLQKNLPSTDFTLIRQPPFVVVGDETPEVVKSLAVNTVQWAVDRLKKDYFTKNPSEIIDIWLFKDKESYEKHAQELFGEPPDTPFGYYSAEHHALVMNIATGGGTLVHEIVHPFMRANFPKCPPWFNEGLASLYEQSRDQNGHIHGLTNWRLAGLQEAIRTGKVPTFEKLLAVDDDTFYGSDKGVNYAQARYLCYYLQERNLLVKFYREFVANQKDDPTGFKTLRRILGEADMNAFQKKWESFVLKLQFP